MGSGAALVLLVLGTVLHTSVSAGAGSSYVGARLGALSQLHHGVRGTVYAVDSRTIYLQDFHYDGEGPAAYFYVGRSGRVSATGGLRVRDERGGTGPLRRYRGEGVTLALPDGHTLKDLKWFAIWCDEFSVNFGSIDIPHDVEYPKPARAAALRGVHGVSSDPIVVVDAQTILVPNFSYDGEAPDAKFWVGRGEKPSPQGIRIPDENGKESPLRKYDKKTIVLTLPGELTVFDIGHFGVWCEAFTVNFGHVVLPHDLVANVPPSLKMLGVSPQSKLNCEVLLDELAFEVRWAVAGDSIVLQLVAKLEDGEYMSFGISGDAATSQMVGADVAVAWVDKQTLKGYAVDYYLDAKSQCAGVRGSCPDERLGEKTNSIRLLNAALVNGYSIVTYQRSLRAADQLDRPVLTNGSQPVVWALGPLNSRAEVSYHHHFTKGDRFIEFGRPPRWNCPMPEGEDEPRDVTTAPPPAHRPPVRQSNQEQSVIKPNPVPPPAAVERERAWDIPGIQCNEPPDGVFYAQMGPTGGKHGYSAITGHVGWGISWYINGLLIPEVTVVRGKRYTFVVEGGLDADTPARYHPFYITNDPVGGYYHKTDEEKKGIEIYAGVRRLRSGEVIPTGVGRLCNWTPDENAPPADEFPSFGAYQRSLTLVCDEGNPGLVTWTPDHNTPDTVYYQCFTHRHLGWKINVVDECDEEGQESRVQETVALPDDLQQEESIQVATRLEPDSNFLDRRKKVEKIINTKTTYNDFSSDKDRGVLTGETYGPEPGRTRPGYERPVVSEGQIHDVIRAIEGLDARPNGSAPHQYLVHEEPELPERPERPERPVREGDEYVVQPGRAPASYFLPPGAGRPLTLQTVLRPAPHRPAPPRPYRRPAPPDIALRRPPHPQQQPQQYPGHQNQPKPGFPLSMPTHGHPTHSIPKKPYGKPQFNRMPPNMNRPPSGGIPPMKAMPPLPHSKPAYGPPKQVPKTQVAPVQMIVMGKPSPGKSAPPPSQSQTLSLGHADLVANQVVKSHITLPGGPDSVAASSSVQTFASQPGQIILGKPMDHPVPLDQQMMPAKHYSVVTAPPSSPPETKPSTSRPRRPAPAEEPTPPSRQNEIKSSDFIGESTDQSTLQPAVNTGFKPNTIVIESGFKPIIREPLMDRVGGDYDVDDSSNRRQDTDVQEDYEESPQPITNHVYETPSDKITQSFEPMFIPSPPDLLLPTDDRTKEVFPKNHAKEDRPHPVYVKTESELNALFGKKNMEKEVPSDMVMESDRVSPQYLPPDPKLPKEHSQKLSTNEETFTTYDGKTISAATLTSISDPKVSSKIFSSKLPANSEQLLKTPQFGPFRGEIPPAVAGSISGATDGKDNIDTRTTHLKLVNAFTSEQPSEPLKAEGSETHETVAKVEEQKDSKDQIVEKPKEEEKHKEKEQSEESTKKFEYDDEEEFEEYDDGDEDSRRRRRDVTAREEGSVNQIEFQSQGTSAATTLHWTSLLILPLLHRVF